jgi:hypothetical protein
MHEHQIRAVSPRRYWPSTLRSLEVFVVIEKKRTSAMSLQRVLTLLLAMPGLLLVLSLSGCSGSASPPPSLHGKVLNPVELQILRSLAKGHKDKTQLAFLADFKGLTKPVGAFNSYMSSSQGKLLRELKLWAHHHQVKLNYDYRPGLFGKAQKIIADDEGSLLLHSNAADFQRRYLMMMYMDFSWQLAMDKAALRQAQTDHSGPGLMRYLHNAMAVNKQSLTDLWMLLKRYHWQKTLPTSPVK